MVLFSLGLPGRFAEWCDAVVFRLAQRAFGSVELTHAGTLEELGLAVLRTGISHFVVSLRQPGAQWRAVLRETNHRFVVAIDDPRNAVADLVERCGLDMAAGTKSVASSCAVMLGYTSMPGALVLTAKREGWDPVSAVAAIARHFELALDESDIAEIVSELADPGTNIERSDACVWWNSCKASERAIVDGALTAYVEHFGGGDLGPIVWGRDLFLISDNPTERAIRPIDVTGRVRCLLGGPCIVLPPGSWSASVVLGFSKEAAELSYVVDVFAVTQQLACTSVRPGNEGVFDVKLSFSIEESIDYPVEIRVSNERAAFDGFLVLDQVTLSRQTPARPERLADLATVLGIAG
jgi:hypothetical protein